MQENEELSYSQIITNTFVCSRQFLGEHIRCISGRGVPCHVINTFCFFPSTYTLWKGQLNESTFNNISFAHPGVLLHLKDKTIIHHAYYQWVPFFQFFQAMLFYLPHFFWRNFEQGTTCNIVEGLQRLYLYSPDNVDRQVNGYIIYSAKTTRNVVKKVHKQFQTKSRFWLNRYWGIMLVFCEFVNLVNVVIHLLVIDQFLGGSFLNLGKRILLGKPYNKPLDQVFERHERKNLRHPLVLVCNFGTTFAQCPSFLYFARHIILEKRAFQQLLVEGDYRYEIESNRCGQYH